MKVNANFKERVVVRSRQLAWIDSPIAGVRRRLLDRVGNEVARATTIVQYAPGSQFAKHNHPGGEEFIVLDGVFRDENGEYPRGTYVRNPPTTSHLPGSEAGCTIFVKLWQFHSMDRVQMKKTMSNELAPPDQGISTALLHQDSHETVRYHHLEPGVSLDIQNVGGAELLILEGSVSEKEETLHKWDWLRSPNDQHLLVSAQDRGAKIWIKTGHLANVQTPSVGEDE